MRRKSQTLQNNLKQIRSKVGLTQGELASRAGISRQAYSTLESGNANPSTEVSLRLAEALNERIESLFFLTEQPPASVQAELVGGPLSEPTSGQSPQRARL
ncbi:MAG: helix-turn-helix transcriptional regulator, partial [Dehalococcoidia bacterium]|nr:helix-turn-helix transcriptional regulator [Dehalococcoidia bacterium]